MVPNFNATLSGSKPNGAEAPGPTDLLQVVVMLQLEHQLIMQVAADLLRGALAREEWNISGKYLQDRSGQRGDISTEQTQICLVFYSISILFLFFSAVTELVRSMITLK